MYVEPNFPSKKALKEAIKSGMKVTVFQPNGDLYGMGAIHDGECAVEGPHYPKPHTWYARVLVKGGVVTQVLS